MIYALKALQKDKDILINTMDVFIKEPLLDWEKYARKIAKEQTESIENTAQQKIDTAKQKLQGYNPAYITVDELRKSIHANKSYSEKLENIVSGDKQHNTRACIGKKCSSVKEQVACLIDQATDRNILGRTYAGWIPWV